MAQFEFNKPQQRKADYESDIELQPSDVCDVDFYAVVANRLFGAFLTVTRMKMSSHGLIEWFCRVARPFWTAAGWFTASVQMGELCHIVTRIFTLAVVLRVLQSTQTDEFFPRTCAATGR